MTRVQCLWNSGEALLRCHFYQARFSFSDAKKEETRRRLCDAGKNRNSPSDNHAGGWLVSNPL